MTIKQQIISEISKVIKDWEIEDVDVKVDYPSDPKHGDYSSNVALIGAKKLGNNPMELAQQIAAEFKAQSAKGKIFEKIEVVKPGFINFSLSSEFLIHKLQSSSEITKKDSGKKIVVEYSSPNIAKPFTIGHLRSTVIGDAIANLLEATGSQVFRDSHVGDWGTQFGKQIYAVKEWGDEAEIEKSEHPVKILVGLYVKFHEEAEKNPELEDKAREWFKKLENGDPVARDLWQKCIDWSWKEFDAIYKELGVPSKKGGEFENNGRGYGESFFEDKMDATLEELKRKGLLKTGKEGAQIVEFDKKTKLPPLMILKKDGATLYATRDLATDKFRLENYGKDVTVINEVGVEQSLYFQQLYMLEQMLGWYKKEQRVHVKHGLIRFKDGKMSTRKGNTIWLEDVIEEAKKRACSLGESSGKITTQVAIGAIKWNDLKRDPKQDIMFDWDEVLNMQGNSGPYVQYAYARTQSVLAKVQSSKLKVQSLENLKLKPEERELLRLLNRFDEVVQEAAIRFAPNILANYLFELAQAFNLFYQKCPIIKSEKGVRSLRLSLTQKTGEVIKDGLKLLGIESPAKM